MAIQLKQSLRLSQQLVMTPQLQQAIKLLQLNRMELAELITQELVENPVLEESGDGEEEEAPSDIDEEGRLDPESEQKMDEQSVEAPKSEEEKLVEGKDDFNWESYIEDFNSTSSTAPSMREINEELPSFESAMTKTTSLEEHVRWQLSMSDLLDNEKKF